MSKIDEIGPCLEIKLEIIQRSAAACSTILPRIGVRH